jgi:hypothetical protein
MGWQIEVEVTSGVSHKELSSDCTKESKMAMAETQGLVQSSSICTSLVGALTPFLIALACMIVVRPLATLCRINKIKVDRMHLFDTEAGATPFRKKTLNKRKNVRKDAFDASQN